MRQPIGTAWSPVGLSSVPAVNQSRVLTPMSIPWAKCDAQVPAMASDPGRKPSGWRVRETHLHTGVDHRHKHHQGQQQETRQVEAQHEQGAGGGGERNAEKELRPGRKSKPHCVPGACPAFGAQIPGLPDYSILPTAPKKSCCSKGPCRTVLQYSLLLLIPPSGHRPGGPSIRPQGASGE